MKPRPSRLLPALGRSNRKLASGLRACPGKIAELSQADFRSPAPIADVVHQAAHQADSSSMLGSGDAGIGGRGGSYVKTWTGVLDYERESRWINLHPAANCLGAVVLAAVECGIGQCFLKSDKDVDLLAFVGAVFLDEGHHRLAHSHYGFRVSREGELPGDRLLLHGLMAFRQANTSRAMRSWPSPRPSLKSRQRAPQHRQVSRDKQPEEPTVSSSGRSVFERRRRAPRFATPSSGALPSIATRPTIRVSRHRVCGHHSDRERDSSRCATSPCSAKFPPPVRAQFCPSSAASRSGAQRGYQFSTWFHPDQLVVAGESLSMFIISK